MKCFQVMSFVIRLAIKNWTGFSIPALVGYGQLVEDANRPPLLKICIVI